MIYPESAITAAAYLFERANGDTLDETRLAELKRHGIENIDPDVVARELKFAVDRDHKSDSTYRYQAYWALGKKHDATLIPYFRDWLSLEVRRDLLATYQILIALDNLNESVFSSARDGYSYDEYELNQIDALSYLDSVASPDPTQE